METDIRQYRQHQGSSAELRSADAEAFGRICELYFHHTIVHLFKNSIKKIIKMHCRHETDIR